jgi:hypothetical protein
MLCRLVSICTVLLFSAACEPEPFNADVTRIEFLESREWFSNGSRIEVVLDGDAVTVGDEAHQVLRFDVVLDGPNASAGCRDWDASTRPASDREFLMWNSRPSTNAVDEMGEELIVQGSLCGPPPTSLPR